jgi:PGM1 C-terminal domain/ATP-grasp domain
MRAERRSFDELQTSLIERLRTEGPSALLSGTVVVTPSISFPAVELRKIIGIEHYEERMLFMLLYLADPRMRVLFVSSVAIESTVVDYFLSFLDDPEDARSRLEFVSLGDPEARALSEKLLERPDAIELIRDLAGADAYMLPFNVTPLEKTLSELTQIPVYGAHPDLAVLGSKSGGRRVAAEAGVSILPGAEDLFSLKEIETAAEEIRERYPKAGSIVIKLNNGFSGQGNAIVSLAGPLSPLESAPTVFCATEESWPSYAPKISAEGAVIEQHIRTPGLVSPSAQMRILATGNVEAVSTHDQILGGPDDQVYLGCRFPAAQAYRSEITAAATEIGRVLSDKGVIGSFGIDFVIEPGGAVNLSEINLRLGGTTHPFLTAHQVTGGTYDAATVRLLVGDKEIHYVSTDNLKADSLKAITASQAISAIEEAGLAFDRATARGVVLHLLGALPRYGKVGTLAISDSPEDADRLYRETEACLSALRA